MFGKTSADSGFFLSEQKQVFLLFVFLTTRPCEKQTVLFKFVAFKERVTT